MAFNHGHIELQARIIVDVSGLSKPNLQQPVLRPKENI